MDAKRLAKIKERCEQATEGPMYAVADPDCNPHDPRELIWTISSDPNQEGWSTDSAYPGYGLQKCDAEFYAHARTDIPYLLGVVEELREENKDLKRQVKNWERKEVERAACCYENELRVERLEKQLSEAWHKTRNRK